MSKLSKSETIRKLTMEQIKDVVNIMNVFEKNKLVKICAPMVRYSKLQFRTLVRSYDCDICFTPMILADSFKISDKARNNEFTTNLLDVPLITQFAANNADDFVTAGCMVSQFCDGIDLNCGCPQRWARQKGLGCVMLENPELIMDIVKQCRNKIQKPFAISVKTRILSNTKQTVEICKQLEKAGVTFLTIHGRTPSQTSGEVNTDTLKIIADSISCPLVANGGVNSLQDCFDFQQKTNCRGVMVANGILSNPTLFSGSNLVTKECVQNWLDICYNSTLSLSDYCKLNNSKSIPSFPKRPTNLTFQCFHHHLVFMLEKVLPKKSRRVFNNLQSFSDVLTFLKNEFDVSPKLYDINMFKNNAVLKTDYSYQKSESIEDVIDYYNYDNNAGSYFESRRIEKSGLDVDCDISSIFIED